MDNINQNNKKISCPQSSCLIFIILYFIFFIFILKEFNILIIYSFINILIYTIIFIFVNKGIDQKNYNFYSKGLKISLIFSIILTIIKLLIMIIWIIQDLKNDNFDINSQVGLYMYIFTIFINWIITRILFEYKNDVKQICHNPLTIQNLIDNNIQN